MLLMKMLPMILFSLCLFKLSLSMLLTVKNMTFIIEWDMIMLFSSNITSDIILEWSNLMYSSTIMFISSMVMKLMTAIILSIIHSLTMSPWYAMMLFMIYVGGMMVMFSYFVSLSSNDSMMMKTKFHFIILPVTVIEMFKLQLLIPNYSSMEMNELCMHNTTTVMLLMTMIVLIVMFIMIKMVKTSNGPLQGFNDM